MIALHKPERATYDQAVEAQHEQEQTFLISCCIPLLCDTCAFAGLKKCCK